MNIKIQDLTKVYPDGHKALNGLNLNIEPGMFGLLGPNGAGKTTLMRIMTLLQNPSSGTIFFDDYDILRDRKAIRSVLGYLPQDFRFFEKLKTWEFLDYGAGLAGIKGTRKRSEIVDEMLRKVGLYEVRDRWANRLSGGMKRRLGIAQAIIGNPKVIIVDEPTPWSRTCSFSTSRRRDLTRKNESGSEISFRKSVIKMSSLSYPLTLWGIYPAPAKNWPY